MSKVKIGLIREGKIPVDRRVPITPLQAKQAVESHPTVSILAEKSEIRCFVDHEYAEAGIPTVSSLQECDIILGVKEVPVDQLLPNKTYFFFSHTIKRQSQNRKLLQAVIEKKIRLIDYETLTDESGKRIIAFGRWAGIVGAYNAMWTFGKRYNLFDLRRAHTCKDLEDLKTEYVKVKLPAIKIVLTGGGRVAKGALEVLIGLRIRKVTPHEFITEQFSEPVFTQLNSRDYHKRIGGDEFSRNEFYNHPDLYEADFLKYAEEADVLIAAAYWDPKAPVLFTRKDMTRDDFKIRVIADVTCDIDGSIPSTKRATTIEDPVYDYNPSDDQMEAAFSDEGNITVMAVDNLPCELPRDASTQFGSDFVRNVLPHLLENDEFGIIQRATIAEGGKLTARYSYLKDYVEGK